MKKGFIKKGLSLLIIAGITASALAGCGGGGNTQSSTASTGVAQINGGKPVKLIVNLGEYNPSTNETPTQENPTVFNSTRQLAKKFMTLYPNVKIEWDMSTAATGGDYVETLNQWMLPRLSSNNAMDVASNLGGASLFGDSGWFLDMSEYLNEKNEFISGNTKWKDIFPSYLMTDNMIINSAGKIVGVPFMLSSGSPTAYFYNKKIFKELNITPPKTWEEMFQVCAKIKKNSKYTAFAPQPINTSADLQCWDTQFSLGPIFAKYKFDILDYNKDGVQDQSERLRAVKEGVYNPVKNSYAMDIWKQVYRKYKTILEEGYENIDYTPLWQEGKVAIMEDGMWRLPSELSDTKRTFDFGIFPPPTISNDTYSYLPETKYTTKGPNKPAVKSAFTILKSSVEAHGSGVKEAAIAFVKFMTQTESLNSVVLEKKGAVLGPVKDCVIPPELKEWMNQSFPIYPTSTGWLPINGAEGRKNGNKLLERWLNGSISEAEFAQGIQKESQADADKTISDMKIDTSGWNIEK